MCEKKRMQKGAEDFGFATLSVFLMVFESSAKDILDSCYPTVALVRLNFSSVRFPATFFLVPVV